MKHATMGLAVGVLAAAIALVALAPRLMLIETASPLDLASAVTAITNRAVEAGWTVSSVMALDESVRRHGGDAGRPVRVIKLCHPAYAGEILRDDRARIAATMMPCSIAVYETADGVRIGAMNAGLLGRLFGGVIGRVMAGPVAADQAHFVQAASRPDAARAAP